MASEKFYKAEDAARRAAEITNLWKTEDGDTWDRETLIDVARCADGDNPLDEEFTPDEYYLVSENGEVGFTGNDGEEIYRWAVPVGVPYDSPVRHCCPSCGAQVGDDDVFCSGCGHRLK